MKVIFKSTVKGVGKIDEVKEVADGYALNFLIPNGKAVRATTELLEQLANKKALNTANESERKAELDSLLSNLKATKRVTIRGHEHSKNVLYQAVTAQEIAHAIHETHKIFITKDLILNYQKPIKEPGDHMITIGSKENSIQYQVTVE
jgi:large subunit ribosomal protein L9